MRCDETYVPAEEEGKSSTHNSSKHLNLGVHGTLLSAIQTRSHDLESLNTYCKYTSETESASAVASGLFGSPRLRGKKQENEAGGTPILCHKKKEEASWTPPVWLPYSTRVPSSTQTPRQLHFRLPSIKQAFRPAQSIVPKLSSRPRLGGYLFRMQQLSRIHVAAKL